MFGGQWAASVIAMPLLPELVWVKDGLNPCGVCSGRSVPGFSQKPGRGKEGDIFSYPGCISGGWGRHRPPAFHNAPPWRFQPRKGEPSNWSLMQPWARQTAGRVALLSLCYLCEHPCGKAGKGRERQKATEGCTLAGGLRPY